MTPERFKEVDRVFAAALELEPDARAAYLDQACAHDSELRKEVESLLANDVAESLVGQQAVEEATRLLVPKSKPQPPKFIGPYRIVRSLGEGGMGHVYLAHDERLNRPVAVKLLSGYNLAEAERIRRFRREALAASALNHPNILTIHEIGEDQGHNYIATEFVDGQTLLELVSGGPLPVTKATDIAIQICSALAAAHAAGIIHRDIKPANIMVRHDGLLKVLDFGIAKYSETDDSPDNQSQIRTAAGTVIGTAAYMSPEQARGLAIDPRTDLWSAGAILYELTTGRKAFQGETALDTMAAVIEKPPLPFSAHRDIPQLLEQIVFKALQKNREARYQTAGDLLTDLKQLAKNLEAGDENATRVVPVTAGRSPNADTAVSIAVLPFVNMSADPASASPAHVAGSQGSADGILYRKDVSEFFIERSPELTQQKETKGHQALTSPGKPWKSRYLILGGLALLFLLVAGLIYWSYVIRQPPISSIAVMPFVNESGNADVEYLSDGMTDTLITSLSQLPQLSVKARSSVFRYKGKDASAQQVGKELNVQAVLNGRVMQRGNDLTLHIELVDVKTETALWSGDYNRSMTNLATLQGEIARDVSQKLRVRLSRAEEQRVTRNYTDNAEAYQLYLRGRYHYSRLTRPEIDKAIEYYQQAIAIDKSYALAYTGLAAAYRSLTLTSDVPSNETMPKAKAAALRALEIDETLAEGHSALGVAVFWYDWDWKAAEKHFQRALELDPNNGTSHMGYAQLLSCTGQHEKALSEARRSIDLEPLNLRNNAVAGQALFFAGRYEESIDRLQKTIELDPSLWLPHMFLAKVYIEEKRYPEAVTEATKARDLSGGNTESVAHMVRALVKSGKQAEARTILDELKKRTGEREVPPYAYAEAYNGLGETDQSLAWLEKGLEQRDVRMVLLTVDPQWNNLRSDPRFQDILRRAGFGQ